MLPAFSFSYHRYDEAAALRLALEGGHLHFVEWMLGKPHWLEHYRVFSEADHPGRAELIQASVRSGSLPVVSFLLDKLGTVGLPLKLARIWALGEAARTGQTEFLDDLHGQFCTGESSVKCNATARLVLQISSQSCSRLTIEATAAMLGAPLSTLAGLEVHNLNLKAHPIQADLAWMRGQGIKFTHSLLKDALWQKRPELLRFLLDTFPAPLPLAEFAPSFTTPNHAAIFDIFLSSPKVNKRLLTPGEFCCLPLPATQYFFQKKLLDLVASAPTAPEYESMCKSKTLLWLREHDFSVNPLFIVAAAVHEDSPSSLQTALALCSPEEVNTLLQGSLHFTELLRLQRFLCLRWLFLRSSLATASPALVSAAFSSILSDQWLAYDILYDSLRFCCAHELFPEASLARRFVPSTFTVPYAPLPHLLFNVWRLLTRHASSIGITVEILQEAHVELSKDVEKFEKVSELVAQSITGSSPVPSPST